MKNDSAAVIPLDVTTDLALMAETPGPDASNNLKDNLLVKWTCDTDDDGSLGDETPTSELSVSDWVTAVPASLVTITPGNAIFCSMSARVPSTAGNNIQGDSLTFDSVYDATQPAPTP